MKRIRKTALIMVFAALVIAGLPGSSSSRQARVEPEADQLLQEMSTYLTGLERFSIQTENSFEVIIDSGAKIQYDIASTLSVQRPNKLHAKRDGDLENQALFYDGKTLTLYTAGQNYYAVAKTPSTIEEALDFATQSLGLFAPGGDLIYKNSYDILMKDVVSGIYVGLSFVGGVKCHHLAFVGNEVDFQIWIEDGMRPLPRKFIITSKWISGAPQFTVLIRSWNVSPEFAEDMFVFVPPEDAQKIEFLRSSGTDAVQP